MKGNVSSQSLFSTKQIIIWTTIWALVIFCIGYLAQQYLAFTPTYPYFDALLAPLAPNWLARWGGFDGVHYITIVNKGYVGTGLIQAFFPMYPLVVRTLNVLRNPLVTGLIVSFISTVISSILLIKSARLLYKNKTTRTFEVGVLLAAFTFPTAFFFLGLYTESMFLALVLGAWYAAMKHEWLCAALLAGIVSGTRVVGIALFPALLVFAYLEHKKEYASGLPWKTWAVLCLSATGLVLYMLYLQREFHDPLYFFHVQSEFGAGRQERLILFPQVLFRYIRILLSSRWSDWSYYAYLQEFVLTVEVGIALTLMSVKKSLRNVPFLIFSWITYLVPPLTGVFSSMPRYVLVIFPLYFLYAKLFQRHRWWGALIFCAHAILLVINIALFIQGKWVA